MRTVQQNVVFETLHWSYIATTHMRKVQQNVVFKTLYWSYIVTTANRLFTEVLGGLPSTKLQALGKNTQQNNSTLTNLLVCRVFFLHSANKIFCRVFFVSHLKRLCQVPKF